MADQPTPQLDEPCLQELLEALKILVDCAQTHQIEHCRRQDNFVPTLATLARHYNLKKTNKVLVLVVVMLSKLCRRLRGGCHGNIDETRKKFPEFFQIIKKESSEICKLAKQFSTAKEDRHKMEEDVTKIRNSLDIILQQLEGLQAQKHSYDNRYHAYQDNRITEFLAELDMDWAYIDKARSELPAGYLSTNFKDAYEKVGL